MAVRWTESALGSLVTLKTDSFCLTVLPEHGALVVGLVHRPTGVSIVRTPATLEDLDRERFLYGIPILFPAGRIAGGRVVVDGHVYQWPLNDPSGPNHLHGFLWNARWVVESATDRQVTLMPDAHAQHEIAQKFGSPLHAQATYRLDGEMLILGLTVTNTGTRRIPFGAGYHTAIDLTTDWALTLPEGAEWEMGQDLMPTGRPPGALHVLQGTDVGRPAREIIADTCYRVNDGVRNVARLTDARTGLHVEMHAEPPYTQWVIYRPEMDSPFICVEPVTWVHNAAHLDLPPALTGFSTLAPGESRSLQCAWRITGSETA